MKCTIPNQNVKIIARAILSLSKIGDEMFIEPSPNEITFRTINMAQSAFAEFKMTTSFFSSFSFVDPEDCDSVCKVTMRSCYNVFKNLHNMDKQVESCEIRMKPEATTVIFQIKFTNAQIKKYYLPIIDSEKIEANIPTEILNRLTASSKMLMSTIKNFRFNEDEITINVEKEKTFFKNHVELKKDVHSMRTELCFHPTEFEVYSVSNPACVTFCFKEFRAILSFAEPSNLSVSLSFSSPGKPILFQVTNFPAYEASYVVSTLNPHSANLEMNLTRPSRVVNQTQALQNLSAPQEQENPYNFINETEPIVQESSLAETSLQHTNSNMNTSLTSSSHCPQNEGNNTQRSKKRKNSDTHSFNLSEGIESIYSSVDNDITNKNRDYITGKSVESTLGHSSNKVQDVTQELVRIVFSRCFRNSNTLKRVSGKEIILADVSDTESV